MKGLRTRLRGDERGFTLPEVLVTIMILIVVLFALYSIFDMGIRVFSFGNDKLEAVENARLGLEKMEREIRAAYPYDLTATPPKTHRFFSTSAPTTGVVPSSPQQITFGNDLGIGDRKITCPNPAGNCEYITYKLSGSTLVRNNTVNGSTDTTGNQPVVENIRPDDPATPSFDPGLTFTPLTATGGTPANEGQIAVIRIRLDISVPGDPPRTQTLTTDVTLRNRS